MDEDQYLEYCRKYTEQMGMPFDEGMVRRHYQQMKAAYEAQKQGSAHGTPAAVASPAAL